MWGNALSNQQQAVADYRSALALGGTEPLPELFATAGAEFRFDEAMLTDLVTLIDEYPIVVEPDIEPFEPR